ncbi:MAG: hypothetical protein SF339_05235 [Blastocatellia bacterium]|nr:hypothetical protein [Blastocatellia bacterium]
MQTVILAPIHVDALYVREGRRVSQPMADFTRLPYFDGSRDVNASIAWLSEEIVAEPFQDEHFFLDKGIHLHWSFPQALTRAIHLGKAGDGAPTFPPLPNRWLVTRGREGAGAPTIEKQWVIESDYLWPEDPEGRTPAGCSVAYPNWEGRAPGRVYHPFRRLGRALSLEAWMKRDRAQGAYLREPLTAVGYGEPGFAAFYPNCHSVFGFHDPQIETKIPEGLYYQVIGWYDRPEQDYLQILLAEADRTRTPDQVRRHLMVDVLKERLRWAVPGEAPTDAIIACRGRVAFHTKGDPLSTPSLDRPMATFGASVTEALSSYLAMEIANDLLPGASDEERAKKKAEIEDQLEAVMLAPQLDHRELDLAARFQEARHAKGFVAVDAGILWAVRPETGAAPQTDADLAPDLLWPEVAAPLAELNRLQKAYNEAWDEIQAARRQLFSDWYKYMLCAYPPENDEADYPKIAQVRFYIEHQALPALERKLALAGTLERIADDAILMKASADSRDYSLARRIEQAMAAVREAVAAHRKTQPTPAYALQSMAAPRFWRPTEPVVLLTGGMVDGQEWRDREIPLDKDERLPCRVVTIGRSTIGEVADRFCADLDREAPLAGRVWKQQPWHPFMLHWEVELTPFGHRGNLTTDSREYDSDFVTRNFTLKRADVDLSPKTGRPALARGAHVYQGASLLTPHVVDPCLTRLKDYLAQVDADLAAGSPSRSPLDAETRDRLDRALKRLTAENFLCLAQTLSGFNDALLMHKQTLQLPIADPLGFEEARQLAARVEKAVDHQVFSAPQPFDDFSPIRTGELRIRKTRLIGTFGRIKDFECDAFCSATPMPARLCEKRAAIFLPPRLAQPARLQFRFLAAGPAGGEMNSHPGSAPICGWVLVNYLDQSLVFHDAGGEALGALETDESERVRWRSAPGRAVPLVQLDQIGNAPLRRMIDFFLRGSKSYFQTFLRDLEAAQKWIEPELAGDAFLHSAPLALVRASLKLELQGPPAAHQGWNQFRRNMTRSRPVDDRFTQVRFPFRLGEQDRLSDGLTVYWLEDETGGYQDNAYIIPNYDDAASAEEKKCDFLYQSVEAPPFVVTMLLDPRAMVHATMGVLPTKAIQIPPHFYADALRRIETAYLAAPLLVDRRGPDGPPEIALPVADPPGYHWSWLERQGRDWADVPINAGGLYTPFAASVEAREGWLKLTRRQKPQGDGNA